MAWWQYPVTQAHGQSGEQGVDLGTPFHTPLTAILGGTVQAVDCSPGWRCEVDIATMWGGKPYVEGYLHVDQPAVSPGQYVAAGDLIGLSGGQLSGGSNPDVQPFSTGSHVEFDMWEGGQPWQHPTDPTALVQNGPQIGQGGPAPSNPALGLAGAITGTNPDALGQAASAAAAAANPWGGFQQSVSGLFSSAGNWIHDRAVPFAGANVIALVVAALVLVVVFGIGRPQGQASPGILPVPV